MTRLERIREMLGGVIAPSLIEKRDNALRLADVDALTGLANRAAFDKALPQALQDKLSFVLFDLNNFGKVNKAFSHTFGDGILVEYARLIGLAAKAYNCRAFRLGGDEFVIIVSSKFAGTIRDKVEAKAKKFIFKGFTVSISGTCGETVEKADANLQMRKYIRKVGRVVEKGEPIFTEG